MEDLERECAEEEYLNEIPMTEEELFNQILENERRDQEINPILIELMTI